MDREGSRRVRRAATSRRGGRDGGRAAARPLNASSLPRRALPPVASDRGAAKGSAGQTRALRTNQNSVSHASYHCSNLITPPGAMTWTTDAICSLWHAGTAALTPLVQRGFERTWAPHPSMRWAACLARVARHRVLERRRAGRHRAGAIPRARESPCGRSRSPCVERELDARVHRIDGPGRTCGRPDSSPQSGFGPTTSQWYRSRSSLLSSAFIGRAARSRRRMSSST